MDDKLTRIVVIKDGKNIGKMDVTEKEMEEYFEFPEEKPNTRIEELLKCESPIERLLLLSLFENIAPSLYLLCNREPFHEFSFDIKQQAVIPMGGVNKYRCDFLLSVSFFDSRSDVKITQIDCVIECDGHDFHEKTKEQVAKEKKRDRDLISMGYDVIHFSGSEIWNDADSCSVYVCDFIEKKHDRLLEQLRKA